MGTDLITYTEESQKEPLYITKVTEEQNLITFSLRASEFEGLIYTGKVKDFLYQEAINNLIKKSKFLQLYIQLIENQISEKEYEKELKNNPENYFINLKEIKSDIDYAVLLFILQKLPKNLSVDEVSEIFGIRSESLIKRLGV